MNQITELPTSISPAGHSFNYAVWGANTVVTLANVPWNNDYRDIVRFPGDWRTALDEFIDTGSGPTINIPGMTYAAVGRPIRLQIPFEIANTFNYLRAYNPAQPILGDRARAYYYFVTGVNFIAPDTTELMLQLDVWQTFGPDARFGNIYVERGHVGIANEDAFDNYGRGYLTTPEGFDLGNEYMITDQYSHVVGSARFDTPGIPGMPNYQILVASSVALDEDAGTVDAPKLTSAKGSEMENLPNGAEIYLFNSLGHFKAFMTAMKDKPWMTQGIMSIQAVPRLERYGATLESKFVNGVQTYEVQPGALNNLTIPLRYNWRNDVELGSRYDHLTKFMTYPYMVLEMTTYTGTPLVLKPECWQDANMGIVEVPHFAPPNARLAFYPKFYNAGGAVASSDENGVINDGGEFMDMMTMIANFPTFSVVNNGYMQFMAANANNIAYQHTSADWSQTRALAGAQTSYDQAWSGVNTSQDVTGQGINAAQAQSNLANDAQIAHTVVNGVGGIAGGAARGLAMGPMGAAGGAAGGAFNAAMGALNTSIDVAARTQSTNIGTGLSAGVNRSQTAHMGYVANTNNDLARFSANGDYANAIAGINAKVQDAKMTQPTTAGQVGGDAFTLATYRWGVDVRVKMLQPAIKEAIGEFWLRYGYAVNRFTTMPETFMVMDKFTYWKLKEAYITEADCPETFKQTLRGIFEKGVTVWGNPSDIGNVDTATNAPLAGVTL